MISDDLMMGLGYDPGVVCRHEVGGCNGWVPQNESSLWGASHFHAQRIPQAARVAPYIRYCSVARRVVAVGRKPRLRSPGRRVWNPPCRALRGEGYPRSLLVGVAILALSSLALHESRSAERIDSAACDWLGSNGRGVFPCALATAAV